MSARTGVVVEFQTESCKSTITRPTNTTPYDVGDVVSAAAANAHHTFLDAFNLGPSRMTGVISAARITSSANVAVKPDLELWLFNTDIATVADGAAFAPTDAEMLTRVGIIQFPTADWFVGHSGANAAGNACCEIATVGIPFQGKDTGTKDAAVAALFGQLVIRNAYVPVSGEIFTVELLITKD